MNRRIKNSLYAFGIVFLASAGCDNSEDFARVEDGSANSNRQPQVKQFGTMREVMREGKTEARIRLADVLATPNAMAVGALEGLHGEVTIVDGEVWVSRVGRDGELQVTGPEASDADSASLLTLGHIAKWHGTTIESAVSGRELEVLIEQVAKTAGIDTRKPFPFRIEGKLTRIEFHVINGYCPIATDPATEEKKPWRWSSSEPVNVVIVGFYAPNAVATMTHHGTSIHAHAIATVNGRRLNGHVDSVVVEPGMTLFVPEP